MQCGITINNKHFNAFCYADDVLLTSLTPNGLQRLIHYANVYISGHGLRFNPLKTKCITLGKSQCLLQPRFMLNGVQLEQCDTIQYLGAILSNNPHDHVQARIQACRRAFYSLQGAGLCVGGANHKVISKIWNMVLRPILLYATQCYQLTKSDLRELEMTQARLLKAALGLKNHCRNTELLRSLKVQRISTSIELSHIDMLKSCLLGNSSANVFYSYFISKMSCGRPVHNSLASRSINTFSMNSISVFKYVSDELYAKQCKKKMQAFSQNGITDSITFLLSSQTATSRDLVNLLLSPF